MTSPSEPASAPGNPTEPGASHAERFAPRGSGAQMVAAGIFASRVFGLVRQHVLARYLGTSDAADAFTAALRIPNILQNLFGEGVLSASFIPVYASLRAEGRAEEAERTAGGVLALLALVTAALVLLGVLAAPLLVDLIAPGFAGAKRDLTVRMVRIIFPGTGALVLSAWCLGILNSHRRFLLSYTAPVAWNVAIIVALLWGARTTGSQGDIAVIAAWGALAGSVLQTLVQLPSVLSVLGRVKLSLRLADQHVRTVVRNFGPVFVGRGAVQISAYVDLMLAALLPAGAVAALGYAQQLYLLPVSLFGMSVSAAELPAMSSLRGDEEEVGAHLRGRLDGGLRQIAFFVVPSAVAFFALGDVVTAAIYEGGEFGRSDTLYVWGVLAAAAVGLLASTMGRLYSSAFYAMRDTRTPFRIALVRIAAGIVFAVVLAFQGPALLGIDARWGVAGLTLGAALAGWLELALLRRSLGGRIGSTGLPGALLLRLTSAALVAAGAAWGVRMLLPELPPVLYALPILGAFGLVYVALAAALGVRESRRFTERAARLVGRR